MQLLLIILNLITGYSFLLKPTIKNNIFKCYFYNVPSYKYNEYNMNKDMYTIISKSDNSISDLINILDQHNINYIYIDVSELDVQEITMISKYYNILNFDIDNILIFKNFDEYIGGVFEMYDIIHKD
jgi:hypothetical protein